MEQLRSWFEVPAIAHYFNVFNKSFTLMEFDIEDFEETLIADGCSNVTTFLPDMFICLLQGLYKTTEGLQVTMDNHIPYLQDLLNYHYGVVLKKENPLTGKSSLKELPMRTKVEILYDMINWRLDLDDAMELTKNMDGDEMRVDPVGKDKDGNVYWYFYGSRLYKESKVKKIITSPLGSPNGKINKSGHGSSRKRKKKTVTHSRSGRAIRKKRNTSSSEDEQSEAESDKSAEIIQKDESTCKKQASTHVWSLACSKVEEWEQLIEQFKDATSKNEKELCNNLEALFEDIPQIIDAREAKLQKKLLAMAPRRTSGRISSKRDVILKIELQKEEARQLEEQLEAEEEEKRQKTEEIDKNADRENRYKERERMLEQRKLRAKVREDQKAIRENPDLAASLIQENPDLLSALIRENPELSADVFRENPDIGLALEPELALSFVRDNPELAKTLVEEKPELGPTFIPHMDIKEELEGDAALMMAVLEGLRAHEDAWLFLEPVKEDEAPHYYTYIKNPMDFQTIGDKIKASLYPDRYEFENDVLLIFDNCETYNGTYSPFTKMAFKLKRLFKKLMKEEFPPEPPKAKSAKRPKVEKNVTEVHSDGPQERMEQKVIKPESLAVTSADIPTSVLNQSKARVLKENALKSPLSPISATNYLTTKLGIPDSILQQMTPAQMQALILRYPRPGFTPALQSLMGTKRSTDAAPISGHKLNAPSPGSNGTPSPPMSSYNNKLEMGISDSSIKSTPTTCNTAQKEVPVDTMPKKLARISMTSMSPLHQLADTALAPTKNALGPSKSAFTLPLPPPLKAKSACQLSSAFTTAYSTLPYPTFGNTAFSQNTHITSVISAPPPGSKYIGSTAVSDTGSFVSGLTVSGVPVTVQWPEVKKQLMAQKLGDGAGSSSSNPPVAAVTPGGTPVTIAWDDLRQQLVSQMRSGGPHSSTTGSQDPNSFLSPFNQAKPLNNPIATTSTTPPKTFKMPNVLRNSNGEHTLLKKPTPIRSPFFNSPFASTAHTTFAEESPTSPCLTDAKILSGHSKVQDWLQSSSPFIIQNSSQGMLPPSTVCQITSPTTDEVLPHRSTPAVLHPKHPVLPEAPPKLIHQNYIGSASGISSVSSSSSRVIPIALPNVHRGTSGSPVIVSRNNSSTNNRINVISVKQHQPPEAKAIAAPGVHLPHQMTAVTSSKSNFLDLQKAALQVAAVDKISSKLQNHLQSDKTMLNPQKQTVPGKETLIYGNNSALKEQPSSTIANSQYPPMLQSIKPQSMTSLASLTKVPQQLVRPQAKNPNINHVPGTHPSSTNRMLHTVPISQSPSPAAQLVPLLPGAPGKSAIPNGNSIQHLMVKSIGSVPGTQLVGVLPAANSKIGGNKVLTVLPSMKGKPQAGGPAAQQLIAISAPSASKSQPTGMPHYITVLPSGTNKSKPPTIPHRITVLPSSSTPALGSKQPISKYITLSTKPLNTQQQSQLMPRGAGFVASAPASSIISLPSTVRFQTISGVVPEVHHKGIGSVRKPTPVTLQQQPVRYILPAQTQMPSNPLHCTNQSLLNNTTFMKNPNAAGPSGSAKQVPRIIAKSMPTTHLNGTNSSFIISSNISAGTTMVSSFVTNASVRTTSVISTNMLKSKTVTEHSIPQHLQHQQQHSTQAHQQQPQLKEQPQKQLPQEQHHTHQQQQLQQAQLAQQPPAQGQHNLQNPPQQQSSSISSLSPQDVGKLLLKTTQSITRPVTLITGVNTVSNQHRQQQQQLQQRNHSVKEPHQQQQQHSLQIQQHQQVQQQQRHVVLEPDQLQKLKSEGRIMTGANGQLVMIPPNLVGKITSSVFK